MVGAVCALRAASESDAVTVIAIIRQTGIFSLAQGQATSAHVVNTGEQRGIIINWRVLDSAGNTLAQSERQMVPMGQASSFEYGTGVFIPEGQRTAIRFELTVEGARHNKPGFVGTQEVFDSANRKTTVFLPYIE